MPAAFSQRRKRRAMGDINMVPFIDVMLVLLIILMVTATAVVPGSIDIPDASKTSSRPPDKRIDVFIDDTGRISLSGELQQQDISEERAIEVVSAACKQYSGDDKLAVMIYADSQRRYQQVINVLGQLQAAGVQRVGLAVK